LDRREVLLQQVHTVERFGTPFLGPLDRALMARDLTRLV
jgi:hypothetical protein